MGAPKTESPTKMHAGAGPTALYTFVANVQLDLHVGTLKMKWVLSRSMISAIVSPSTYMDCLVLPQWKRIYPVLMN